MKYVNVYLVDQAYGGPEEGGWYYTFGQVHKSMPVKPDKAERLMSAVERWCEKNNEERPPIYSVSSEGVYNVCLEEHPAEHWPTERPWYE